MAVLKFLDESGNWHHVPAIQGASAYDQAVLGGYTGTLEDFYAVLSRVEFVRGAEASAIAARDVAIVQAALAQGYASQLASGIASPKGVYDDLAALIAGNPTPPDITKIYVTKDNWKWYYHNGTTWSAGGVYQDFQGLDNTLVKTGYAADAKVTGERTNANANWTKDGRNPAEYFPAPSAPLYFRREGTFTQAGSGDPSPTNIRPITPFMANGTQIKLVNSGKNLLDLTTLRYAVYESSIPRLVSSALPALPFTPSTQQNGMAVVVPVLAGKTYTLSLTSTDPYVTIGWALYATIDLAFSTSNKISSIDPAVNATAKTLTPSQNGVLVCMIASKWDSANPNNKHIMTGTERFQLELGSVATPYEPYVGSTATLTAPEEIAAGWINNRGEGQKTWAKKVFDGTELWLYQSELTNTAVFLFNGDKLLTGLSLWSHFAVSGTGDFEKASAATNGTTLYIRINKSRLVGWSDSWTNQQKVDALKAWIAAQYAAGTPVAVVYQPATPVTLTPVSAPINTIPATYLATERLNIFTSSLAGVLTYPKNKVRQDRILNNAQLWRRTASGNPVSAYPAPESPLYPKVSGTFTQEGTGDPSPSNVRPITPWLASGGQVKVKRTGKNLYDISSYPLLQGSWVNGVNGGTSSWEVTARTGLIPVSDIAGKVVTLNKRPDGVSPGFAFYDPSSVFISGLQNNNGASGTPWTITIPINAVYMRFTTVSNATDIQIELGSVSTPYEPYSGQEITLTAPQEIPAGWMDNEGNGQVTWAKKVFDGTETWLHDNGLNVEKIGLSGTPYVYGEGFCSHFIRFSVSSSPTWFFTNSSYYGAYHIAFKMTDGTTDSNESWKAYLAAQYAAGTPVTVYVKLETPIPIAPTIAPLTATPQLDRITPRQNVLTASTGNIELTYAKSPTRESDEIRAAIIAHGGTL